MGLHVVNMEMGRMQHNSMLTAFPACDSGGPEFRRVGGQKNAAVDVEQSECHERESGQSRGMQDREGGQKETSPLRHGSTKGEGL